jgi:hypothetical protein
MVHQLVNGTSDSTATRCVECPHLDSNQGPADYESAALTD